MEENINEKPFVITTICRDDLKQLGFDTTEVDDDTMIQLAKKLSNDYQEQLYWTSLKIIAEEYFEIPLLNKPIDKNTNQDDEQARSTKTMYRPG